MYTWDEYSGNEFLLRNESKEIVALLAQNNNCDGWSLSLYVNKQRHRTEMLPIEGTAGVLPDLEYAKNLFLLRYEG